MPDLVDLLLFARALKLAARAQRVRREPLERVVQRVVSRGGGGGGYPLERVEAAATRSVARWRRWCGGLDTCLTRSLVLGGMLAGSGEVELNIGFRPGEGEPSLHGHAWVTVNGRPVGSDGGLAQERYTRVLAVPFVRRTGEE